MICRPCYEMNSMDIVLEYYREDNPDTLFVLSNGHYYGHIGDLSEDDMKFMTTLETVGLLAYFWGKV